MSGVTMKIEMRRTQYIMKKTKMTKVEHYYYSDRCAYYRNQRVQFLNIIKAKIASEGNGFITADSDPFDIYAKMDLKALKKGFRLVRTHDWIYLRHFKKLKKYETRFLLMKFFLKKSYEKVNRVIMLLVSDVQLKLA
ncbi:hypothetical protein QJS04_geneDACA001223 [Acorus gramineus]|uniref:Uncharacterized protein n=1 Tax=Acorus gramineus TaxID=55184 RepID=A0AAV9AF69_ACOGR|nr:hypothetical protein QJS04_geneDACA001223 [Acorus gramineus]